MEKNGNILLMILLSFALIFISLLIRLAGFMLTHNAALGIETTHISVDFLLTLFVLVVIYITTSKFSRSFSYGLFKLEDLIAFFIALLIIYVGIDFLLTSLYSSPELSLLAALFQLTSIVPLFFAGFLKVKAGSILRSTSLKADGKHTYTDVYEGLGVALGLLAYYFTNWGLFYLFAIVLAFFVLLWTALSVARDSLFGLLDLPKDKKLRSKIDEVVRNVEGVERVKETKLRWSGSVIFAEIVVEMNPLLSIDEAHPITEIIENQVKEKVEGVYSVVVHVEPVGRKNFRILVPVMEKRRDAKISSVLAKSKYFAIVEINENGERTNFIDNPLLGLKEHVAPSFKDFLIEKKITDLICRNIGDSVYGLLLAYNIFCWKNRAEELDKNIMLFKARKLEKMKDFISRSRSK
ncbi:MAG: cation diffusion facilitator family transporter [Candidatus Micrarchaeia archaeon]|jgi:cation diffusion facilitator family transporter